MIRFTSAITAIVLGVMPVQAAEVGFMGEVFRITGTDLFLENVPVAVGDPFDLRATFADDPSAWAAPGGTAYIGGFDTLEGTVGGLAFSLATTPTSFDPAPRNQIIVGDRPERDIFSVVASIFADPFQDIQAWRMSYSFGDNTSQTITTDALDPTLFDQETVDALFALPLDNNGLSQITTAVAIHFRFPTQTGAGSIWINPVPTAPAPIPLPATAPILLTALGLMAAFRRKVTI